MNDPLDDLSRALVRAYTDNEIARETLEAYFTSDLYKKQHEALKKVQTPKGREELTERFRQEVEKILPYSQSNPNRLN